MHPYAEITTQILALGTLGAQLLILLLILVLLFPKEGAVVSMYLKRYALQAAFVISAAGVVLTLVYSEVFGYAPCGLCWLQRVFLYPLPILLAMGLWKKDRNIAAYVGALCVPGAAIALYQHYLQMGGSSFVSCPAAPTAVDCAQRFVFEFGYITFPLMSFTVFVLIAVLMFFVLKKDNATGPIN
ncbi:MAG: thiol-disulfide oxidoreductase-like protein [Parcubacteria group bacterium]|nr:thiol-disulfide oxidoreductase-like protein [Parcubacteria group bacterium]